MTEETGSASADRLPPTEYLRECFLYDPETGVLRWKERPLHHFGSKRAWTKFTTKRSGKIAGCQDRDRLQVSFHYLGKKRKYGLNTIIYRLMGIEVPSGFEIDHKNRIATDNRWENLRLATKSQNCCNRIHKRTKSPLPKWVQQYGKNSFYGQVFYKGVKYPMGKFSTPEEAHAVCLAKAKELHGEFMCS